MVASSICPWSGGHATAESLPRECWLDSRDYVILAAQRCPSMGVAHSVVLVVSTRGLTKRREDPSIACPRGNSEVVITDGTYIFCIPVAKQLRYLWTEESGVSSLSSH